MPDASRFPVPLTILTGFLGAGKTTLLNHILHGDHGRRIAVLVNDFGAINIDSQLVVGVEGESINLSNGCICCTIRDDLLQETVRLLKRPEPPEYIIVETSGVSAPGAVADTFLMPELSPYISVDSILTVADAEHLLTLDDELAELAAAQIDVADIIILNKVDRVTLGQLSRVRGYIGGIAPDARILETTYADVPLELVIGVGAYAPEKLANRAAKDVHVHEDGAESEHEHHHDHSLVFNTFSWTSDKPLALGLFRDAINHLPPTIYRAKGIVSLSDFPERRTVLHIVGRRASLTLGAVWSDEKPRTEIVVIGTHGGVNGETLRQQFEACVAVEKTPEQQLMEAMEWDRADYVDI